MVSGEWTGTMNLTEPQAGSDLAAVRTRAEPTGDGRYKLEGQKIFITYGEHDLAENIIHMVLARTPGAPEGVKGISLFLVPKYLVEEDGSLGARNDVRCISVEHKLGIHASPTCVLAYGQDGGAIGELIGEENRGLEYMFIMMNAARYAVGLEGIGISERAFQSALTYAQERIQGTEIGARARARVPIVHHPDVRRMLMLLKSQTEAMRALAGVVAVALDAARLHPDETERRRHQAFADLMIPIVKGWCTENSVELASLAMQVHGGMGFIEETGVAQQLRDARITPIYEGTTGIQANDLIGRKLARDGGDTARVVIAQMRELHGALAKTPSLPGVAAVFSDAVDALERAVGYAAANYGTDVRSVAVGAVPLLKLFGIVAAGWQLLRSALIAQQRLDAPQQANLPGDLLRGENCDRALLRRPRAGTGPRAGPRHRAGRRGRARQRRLVGTSSGPALSASHRLPHRGADRGSLCARRARANRRHLRLHGTAAAGAARKTQGFSLHQREARSDPRARAGFGGRVFRYPGRYRRGVDQSRR